MPDIEINSAQILAELNKINNGVKAVESLITSSNNANKASYNSLRAGIAGETAATMQNTVSKTANSAATALNTTAVNAQTMSTVMNNAALTQASTNLMLYNAQILTATANLGLYKTAWDAVTMSINNNTMALTMNTATMLQNMTSIMQHTAVTALATMTKDLQSASLNANTVEFEANTAGIDLNSLSTMLNTALRNVDIQTLVTHGEQLAKDNEALTTNAKYMLLSALANAANGLSLFFVNSQLKKQIDNLKNSTAGLKENSKTMLINIIANLGNLLATWLVNKQGAKNVQTVQAQTRAQNAYNGALAAAAILQNPLVGAATVAGAALAQGLISGQKTEAIEIEMGSAGASQTRDISMTETLSSTKISGSDSSGGSFGGSIIGQDLFMTDTETESTGSTLIKGFAQMSTTPKMASGGVVTRPTLALIGEGRYDEAVIPLGNSPQMRNLKDDIANAVVQALMALGQTKNSGNGANSSKEIVLNVDGRKLARILLPKLIDEQKKNSGLKVVGSNV